MKFNIFGKLGWKVSEIGFGAWQLGGDFGKVNDNESILLLLKAWEKGINFVDTAQMYGKGHSEHVIGLALKQWTGDHIHVATKVQPNPWPHPSEDNPDIGNKYARRYLREQCEASLRRLGVEAIDLYQLHCWMPKGLEETEWYETLTELKKEGKIKAFGVSIRDYRPSDGLEAAKSGKVDSQQIIYNLFEQRPAELLFPACMANQIGVIARVPFDEGALIGNWTKDTFDSFEENDVRRIYFKGNRFIETLKKVEEMKKVVKETVGDRFTLAEIALKFCLAHPAIHTTIAGTRNLTQLEANLRVSESETLPEGLLERLKPFNWPRNYWNPDE